MTKQEFKQSYIKASGITEEYFDEYFVVLPCKCGEENCRDWATVTNSEKCIQTHNELYYHYRKEDK